MGKNREGILCHPRRVNSKNSLRFQKDFPVSFIVWVTRLVFNKTFFEAFCVVAEQFDPQLYSLDVTLVELA